MKTIFFKHPTITLFAVALLLLVSSCARELDELEEATYPTTPDVFIDAFSGGLDYGAFGGSKPTAFEVDNEVVYDGEASMRFEVPDVGDPAGAYAGGFFYTSGPRDLSGYDALTFWAKASKAATIDVIGFGNAEGDASTITTANGGIDVNTNWKQYIIPIPNPARLNRETVMLFYSEGPEDDKGYTFWLDEVKFEKLGTLSNQRAAILAGQDQVTSAETGQELEMGDFTTTFNMPNGLDRTFNAGSAYFTFTSSNPGIASVNSNGVVTALDSGTAVITAKIGEIDATGSLTVTGIGAAVGPEVIAPLPTEDPDSVIALFSNAYTQVQVDTWNPYWEFSTAEEFFVQVNGDDVIRYRNLNFVGVVFTSNTLDISEMTHFHIDIWTPDPTNPPAVFKVLLEDLGPDNDFGGGNDSNDELEFSSPLLQTGTWVSIDIPLSNFAGLTGRRNLGQMVLSGDLPNLYIDNVYFYNDGSGGGGGGGDVPTTAAPTPAYGASDVISVFSDAYTNVSANLNPDWGQATATSEVSIAGNNTYQMMGLDYQGIELDNNQDVSSMNTLHLDVWTKNSTAFNVYLISPGNPAVEVGFAVTVPTTGWSSLDIPLTNFSPVDLADVFQFKFDGNGDIWVDNLLFHNQGGGGGGNEPTTAAPTPAYSAADVISVFSDAYTNIGSNLNPDWGQATSTSVVSVAGNNTYQMMGLNYQGIELDNNQDVSGFTTLHLDVWTQNSSEFKVFLISPGNPAVETAFNVTVPTSGWSSVDVPLTNFAPVDLADVFQFKFEGNGDIWVDNLLFHKGGGGGGNEPTTAAPAPTYNAADVISVFSDAYTNIGSNLNPDWGQATATSIVTVAGNNTYQMRGLNYQGIELDNNQDVSGFTTLHLDVWTENSTEFKVFLISPGSPAVETAFTVTVPTTGWSSVDVPLTSFAPVDLADVFQFKFEGNGDVWVDNLLFFK